MSDYRTVTFKSVLQLMSQLLWVLGMVVGLSGVYLLMNYKQSTLFVSSSFITLPAFFALASGVVLVVSGCLGSWLSLRDSTFLQGLFVYLLVVVFCLESTASVLAYYHTTKLDAEIVPLSGLFEKYTGRSQDPISRAVDATQEELQCCGINGYRDWLNTPWFNHTEENSVPHSCCNSTFPSCNGSLDYPWQLYSKGCQVKLEMAFQFMLSFIICGFPLVFAVEVASLITVAQLMKQSVVEYQVFDKKYRY